MKQPRTRGNVHQIAWTGSRNKNFQESRRCDGKSRVGSVLFVKTSTSELLAKFIAHSQPYRRIAR